MAWTDCKSSMIQRYDYDPDMRVLHLQFGSGRIASLQSVPQHVMDAFLAAESKGKFFHSQLRDQYKAL